MEVELYNYLNERDIKNYAAERKHIEEKKLSKENYVKIIAYQTLIGMDRYNEVVKQVKNNLEDNYSVRRHIAVGANRTVFSPDSPTRLCRAGTYRAFLPAWRHVVVALFERQHCFF